MPAKNTLVQFLIVYTPTLESHNAQRHRHRRTYDRIMPIADHSV